MFGCSLLRPLSERSLTDDVCKVRGTERFHARCGLAKAGLFSLCECLRQVACFHKGIP